MTASDRPDDVGALLRSATARLSAAGVGSPRVDAELILAHAAGVDRAAIAHAALLGRHLEEMFPNDDDVVADVVSGRNTNVVAPSPVRAAQLFEQFLVRRCAREPLQHILGRASFRHLELRVGPGVFVPRPETEVVAQVAIDEAGAVARRTGSAVVADLCAGSGAIALAVASEVPGTRVFAVELDAEAFGWLTRNVRTLSGSHEPTEAVPGAGGAGGVRAVRGDARRALTELDGGCDVVVSNPPYVPPDAIPRDPEVAGYDPGVALFGLGGDGFEVPRGIIAAAARLLRAGGLFVMEHAEVQDAAARAAVHATGAFTDVTTGPDLTGRPRMVIARRLDETGDMGSSGGDGVARSAPETGNSDLSAHMSSGAKGAPAMGDSKS